MTRLVLYCHLCGKDLPDYFVAVSPADRTDRPFLTHRDCPKQLDKEMNVVDVAFRREPAPLARPAPTPKKK